MLLKGFAIVTSTRTFHFVFAQLRLPLRLQSVRKFVDFCRQLHCHATEMQAQGKPQIDTFLYLNRKIVHEGTGSEVLTLQCVFSMQSKDAVSEKLAL